LKLGQVGEFGLIHRIREIVDENSQGLVLGIGDDGAVFRPAPDHLAVITTDAMVERVHFDLSYTPLESLGWKALAINISDVAAMGGIPRHGVVSLAIPETWKVEDVQSLYEGMTRCGRMYGCAIIGGDTVCSQRDAFLSVTVVGEVEENKVIRRSGSRIGDVLCVTGELGGSRTGLEVLRSGTDKEQFPRSVQCFLEPMPRVREAGQLIQEMAVSAMIDISDGLASEIGHLCRESGLGCVIDQEEIPIHPEAVLWSQKQHMKSWEFALQSGEEYELLFTTTRAELEKWQNQNRSQLTVTILGTMVSDKEGAVIQKDGEKQPLVSRGWDHFGS
jgi:thiamine-monophosphate kinase